MSSAGRPLTGTADRAHHGLAGARDGRRAGRADGRASRLPAIRPGPRAAGRDVPAHVRLRRATVETYSYMGPALALYTAAGFRPVGRVLKYRRAFVAKR